MIVVTLRAARTGGVGAMTCTALFEMHRFKLASWQLRSVRRHRI